LNDENVTLTPLELQSEIDKAWANKDVDALVALFTADATIESPLVARLLGKSEVRGHAEIRELFQALLKSGVPWSRHEVPAVREDTMFVEYKRAIPGGAEIGWSVDVIDVLGGAVKSLRAYSGAKAIAMLGASTQPDGLSSPHP
jgi:hypothetical protein